MIERRAPTWFIGSLQRVAVLLATSFERSFQWFSASRHPAIAVARETIRSRPVLRAGARALVRGVRILPRLQEQYQGRRSTAVRLLDAILVARDIGGSVTTEELEQIFHRSRGRRDVLVVADGPEREQIEVVLAAAAAKVTSTAPGSAHLGRHDQFNLIVLGPRGELGTASARQVLRVGRIGRRSDYSSFANGAGAELPAANRQARPLRDRLRSGGPVRVVFLNDAGFQYGAGIALKRQVASMLLKGFEVAVFAWTPGQLLNAPIVTGVKQFPGWLGVQDLHEIYGDEPGEEIAGDLATRIAALKPDVVITGNVHGAPWPLALLSAIRSQGILVMAFMHDVYFVTGRCAYPMSCQLYQTGCNASCPTPNEYPKLAPERIAPAWQERGKVFAGPNAVPLVGNSQWTANIVVQRFGNQAAARFVHLALDHELFSPIPRSVARRLLGIPERAAIVLLGAVDVKNQWKGGPLFHDLHQALLKRKDVGVVLFGYMSEALSSLRSFGLVTDERKMALILNCADVYVSAATAEAFGQSLLEASACGVPVVAFDVGAVSEVLVNEETAILVKELNVEALLRAVDRLLADPALRERLGRAARTRVEQRFTLTRQADAWVDLLAKAD
ncbi:glycosyltransferase [Bradyrhizobium sp. CCBAU 51745]|uniref:glycosyltransferase n=1 Tax=Bradyrhizobium sp. CCBAU 51745 TaxID=1325099 RepID=UPI002305FFC3|nr:glycosyltransferase [Bradyrhizobium sp. CCBAU 51745]